MAEAGVVQERAQMLEATGLAAPATILSWASRADSLVSVPRAA
jgi:hypothetical protein